MWGYMINELILLTQIGIISITAFIALRLGRGALVAFSVLQMIIANLFVLKQTTLFGLNATCADAFVIGSLLGFNLLREEYGKSVAKRMISTTFVCMIFFAIVSRVHLLFEPSSVDTMQSHFDALLNTAPWIVVGSILIFSLTQIIDFMIYSFLTPMWPQRYVVFRNYLSLSISQLIDTILFTFFLVWLNVLEHPWHIIAISYAIKMIITLLATPLVAIFLQLHRALGGVKNG
jgi:uncharacterized integral membrane protein (TIGR00697 family)